jgi:trehalose/maltose hydrolase-like predicted phosphorylase
VLAIDPRLPRRFGGLEFSLRFRDRQVRVRLTHEAEQYLLDEGDPLETVIRGEPHRLVVGEPLDLIPSQSPPRASGRAPTPV